MSESIYYPDSSRYFQSDECRAEFAKMDGSLTESELVEFMTGGTVADLINDFATRFVSTGFDCCGVSQLKELFTTYSDINGVKPRHSLGKIPVILDMKQELILIAARGNGNGSKEQ